MGDVQHRGQRPAPRSVRTHALPDRGRRHRHPDRGRRSARSPTSTGSCGVLTDVQYYVDDAARGHLAARRARPDAIGRQRLQRGGPRRSPSTGPSSARCPRRARSPRGSSTPVTRTLSGARSRRPAVARRRSGRAPATPPPRTRAGRGFAALGTGGAVQSPPGRYIEYAATLDDAAPRLDSVSIAYTLDDVAPDAAIAGVQVSGTSATVSFGELRGGRRPLRMQPRRWCVRSVHQPTAVLRPGRRHALDRGARRRSRRQHRQRRRVVVPDREPARPGRGPPPRPLRLPPPTRRHRR